MTAILSCDVFPGLEKSKPLDAPDEDIVPDKFGPKWYEHSEKPQPRIFSELLKNNDSDVNESEIDEVLSGAEPKIVSDSQLFEI